ncbi:hypothetical protein EDD16DRAFT_1472027 [Pisolithus croceorrhizus]|nr:hypothetical protein EDD16DRAFT_1472027 [Pisolithus croceorrhizus]
MSLRLDVLKSLTLDDRKSVSNASSTRSQAEVDTDDELINVFSSPATPARSRAPSRPSSRPSSRPGSPTRRSHLREDMAPLISIRSRSTDPLRAFPTQISQRIFRWLDVSDLAACSAVSRKWSKSQTLNYIWFLQCRQESFFEDTLPPGKWTRRESRENWRLVYSKLISDKSTSSNPLLPSGSGRSSPSRRGYQTPKERNEERWRLEEEEQSRPSKVEMREMYKELGGRKAKTKVKLGSAGGIRDKTGWTADNEDW